MKKSNPYFFVVPIAILIFGLTIYPTIYSFYLSLFSTKEGVTTKTFVGLNNFLDLFQSGTFWRSLFITCEYTIAVVFLETILGFVIALLLKKINVGKTFFRLIFIVPLAISPAIAGLTWRTMYNPSFGVISYIFQSIGFENLRWHTGPSTALLSIILVDVWQWTPFVMIIIYAGLLTIPDELTEAALIDGCSKWKAFFRISLPYIKPIVFITLIFRTLDALKQFDLIFVLTKGGPGRATETLVISSFIDAFYNFMLGRAAAISIILLIISIIITQRILKRIL